MEYRRIKKITDKGEIVADLKKDRLRIDSLIRSRGWIIWLRKQGKPTMWRKGNDELTQNGVLRLLGYEELADAQYD